MSRYKAIFEHKDGPWGKQGVCNCRSVTKLVEAKQDVSSIFSAWYTRTGKQGVIFLTMSDGDRYAVRQIIYELCLVLPFLPEGVNGMIADYLCEQLYAAFHLECNPTTFVRQPRAPTARKRKHQVIVQFPWPRAEDPGVVRHQEQLWRAAELERLLLSRSRPRKRSRSRKRSRPRKRSRSRKTSMAARVMRRLLQRP